MGRSYSKVAIRYRIDIMAPALKVAFIIVQPETTGTAVGPTG